MIICRDDSLMMIIMVKMINDTVDDDNVQMDDDGNDNKGILTSAAHAAVRDATHTNSVTNLTITIIVNLVLIIAVREAPNKFMPKAFGHCP